MPSLDMPVPDSTNDALALYKEQIRELEDELADFQASSKELERELEKELEHSERQHSDLRRKNEALQYEVDEWKVCFMFLSCWTCAGWDSSQTEAVMRNATAPAS